MRRLMLLSPLVALALAGCNAVYAGSDGGYGDYHFHDIRKPHGHARSVRVLRADATACMARTGHSDTLAELPATEHDPRYKSCLLSRGWRFYAYTPAPVRVATPDDDDATPIEDSGPSHDSAADIAALNQAQWDNADAQNAAADAALTAATQANAAMIGQ